MKLSIIEWTHKYKFSYEQHNLLIKFLEGDGSQESVKDCLSRTSIDKKLQRIYIKCGVDNKAGMLLKIMRECDLQNFK